MFGISFTSAGLMKHSLLLLILSVFLIGGPIQAQISAGNDTVFCPPDSVTLSATITGSTSTNNYVLSTIPFVPESTAGTSLTLSDDGVSGAVPIGFNFEFFCNSYTTCYIAANGWVTFSAPGPGWSNNWGVNPIPSAAGNVPKNCIMVPWQDWNPSIGGGAGPYVRYQTIGTAPNRKFVVSYNVYMYSCTGTIGTFQLVLHEGSNIIENHITTKNNCFTWPPGNPNRAVQGLHNINGTVAVVVPGRNNSQWSATNESRRYTPSQINWSAGGLSFGTGQSVTVQPLQPTFYTASTTLCNGTIVSDSVLVSPSCLRPIMDSLDVPCFGDSTGYISAVDTSNNGAGPWTYTWRDSNATVIQTTANSYTADTVFNLPGGNYSVIIIDSNGQVAFGTVSINQPPEIIPTATNIQPISCHGSTTCDGQATIAVTGGFPGYTFTWANGGTSATNFGLCFGDNYVTITDQNGCTAIDTINVPQPDSLTLVASNDTQVCISNSHMVSATAGGGTPPYTYVWSTGQTGSPVSVTTLMPTTYTVQVFDSNNCAGPVDTILVTVKDSLSATATTADDTICIGDQTTLTALALGGDGSYSYVWSNGDIGSPILVSPTVSTLYQVTVTDGCLSPPTVATVFVQVGGYPSIQVTTSPFPVDTICPGEFSTLVASATGGFGGYTYTWNNGLGNGNTHVVSPAQTTQYVVTVTDACNTPAATKFSLIQVGGYPNLNLTTSPIGSDTICKGDFVELSAIAGGGVPPLTYTFGQGLGQGGSFFVNPTVTTTYSVSVEDACLSVVDFETITIHVGDFQPPEFTSDILEGCDPITVNFSPDSIAPPGFRYLWDFGDGTVVTDNDPVVPHAFVGVGCYDITLEITTDLGCKTRLKKPCYIQSRPIPSASFSYYPLFPNNEDPIVTFTDLSNSNFVRHWDLGLGRSSEKAEFAMYYQDTGWQYIELAIANEYGCTDTITDSVFVKYLSTFWVPKAFSPNGDDLNETFGPIGEGFRSSWPDFEMIIYDRWGNLVFESKDATQQWTGASYNDGDILPAGIFAYIIRYREFDGSTKEVAGQVVLIR